METKYAKLPQHVPNGHKMYQHFSLQHPPRFTKIVNFSLKLHHLATLGRREMERYGAALFIDTESTDRQNVEIRIVDITYLS
jgi:hypothetical protein